MKKRSHFAKSCCLPLLLLIHCCFAERPNLISDTQFTEIEFPSTLGKSSEGTTRYQVFVENKSGLPDSLEKINMSCGCSHADFVDTLIQPEDKALIALEIKNSTILSFRVERALVIWKSGRITQLGIGKKNGFGAFVSETSLSWDTSLNTSKSVSIYMDEQTFENSRRNGHVDLSPISTTGAVNVVIDKVDAAKKCVVLTIKPVNHNLTMDIVRFSVPGSPSTQPGFILCKLKNNKI